MRYDGFKRGSDSKEPRVKGSNGNSFCSLLTPRAHARDPSWDGGSAVPFSPCFSLTVAHLLLFHRRRVLTGTWTCARVVRWCPLPVTETRCVSDFAADVRRTGVPPSQIMGNAVPYTIVKATDGHARCWILFPILSRASRPSNLRLLRVPGTACRKHMCAIQ